MKPANVPLHVQFSKCSLFDETWEKHKRNQQVVKAFNEFVVQKTREPLAPFGSKDRRFTAGALTEYIHVGLTFDVSLIYKVSGRDPITFSLYAVVTHDESGTGQPGNINRQRQLGKKMGRQQF